MRILGVDPGLKGGFAIVEDGALVWAAGIPWEPEPITPLGGARAHPVGRLDQVAMFNEFHDSFAGHIDVDEIWIEHPLISVRDADGESRVGNPATFAHFGQLVGAFASYTDYAPRLRFVFPGRRDPNSWQSWSRVGLKSAIETDEYHSIGVRRELRVKLPGIRVVPGDGYSKPAKKWHSKLAALIYFGRAACEKWCIPKGARVLDDGLTDAALIALFGWVQASNAGTGWQTKKLQAAWPEFFQPRAALPPSTGDVPFPAGSTPYAHAIARHAKKRRRK